MRWFDLWIVILIFSNFVAIPRLMAEKARPILKVKERPQLLGQSGASSLKNTQTIVQMLRVDQKTLRNNDRLQATIKKDVEGFPRGSKERLGPTDQLFQIALQRAATMTAIAEDQYGDAWLIWHFSGRLAAEPPPPRGLSSYWQEVIREADAYIQSYDRMTVPLYVYFARALAFYYLDKVADARNGLDGILRGYPDSPVAGDSYAALGDFAFAEGNYPEALKYYSKALTFTSGRYAPWALNKAGWAFLMKKQGGSAVKMFDSRSMKFPEAAGRFLSFARIHAWAQEAGEKDLLTSLDSSREVFLGEPILLTVARISAEYGKVDNALRALKLAEQKVSAERKFVYLQERLNLLFAASQFPAVWQEISSYRRQIIKGKNKVAENLAALEEEHLYLAMVLHKRAIEKPEPAIINSTKLGYQAFLQQFRDSRRAVDVRILLADLEYSLQNYGEAGRMYKETIAALPPKSATHQNVARDMILAYYKDLEPELKSLMASQPDFSKRRALSFRAKNYIQACQQYGKNYPNDLETQKSCDMNTARLFYHSGDIRNATNALMTVAIKYADSLAGPEAVGLLLPMIVNDQPTLQATTKDLLQVAAYKKGPVHAQIQAARRGADIAKISEEQDKLKQAEAYEQKAKQASNSPQAPSLWYAAASAYWGAGQSDRAANAYYVVVTQHPQAGETKAAILQLAKYYEYTYEFDKAAVYYLMFHDRYPQEKAAAIALRKACELHVAAQAERAIETCAALIAGMPEVAVVQFEKIMAQAEQNRSMSVLLKVTNDIYLKKFTLSPNQKIAAYYRIYRILNKAGGVAAQAAASIKQLYEQNTTAITGDALSHAVDVMTAELSGDIQVFVGIKLDLSNSKVFETTYNAKVQAYDSLVKALDRLSKVNNPEAKVVAFYHLGLTNEFFAKSLVSSGKSTATTKGQAGRLAQARIAEAFKFYKTAAETVRKLKVYGPWSIKSLEGFSRVSGGKFVFDDFLAKPDFAGLEYPVNLIPYLQQRGANE